MMAQKVTIIIPTTYSRSSFNERILKIFHAQDYPDKEVLFDYNEVTIGEKLNRLCKSASGTIIARMDSDDLYADDWISKSAETLLSTESDVVGLQKFNLFYEERNELFQWSYTKDSRPFLAGATVMFTKKFWERHPLPERIVPGEDVIWMQTSPVGTKGCAHDYVDGFLCTIHAGNTSPKNIYTDSRYRRMSEEEGRRVREKFQLAEVKAL